MAVGGAAQLPRRRLSVCRAPAKETPRDRGLTGAMDPGAASPIDALLQLDTPARRRRARDAAQQPGIAATRRAPSAFSIRDAHATCAVRRPGRPDIMRRRTVDVRAPNRRARPDGSTRRGSSRIPKLPPFVARRMMCELLVADVSSSSPTREPLDEARRAPDRRKLSTESQDQTVSTSTCVLRTRVRRRGKEREGTGFSGLRDRVRADSARRAPDGSSRRGASRRIPLVISKHGETADARHRVRRAADAARKRTRLTQSHPEREARGTNCSSRRVARRSMRHEKRARPFHVKARSGRVSAVGGPNLRRARSRAWLFVAPHCTTAAILGEKWAAGPSSRRCARRPCLLRRDYVRCMEP